jgi:hypothetical protein
VARAHAFEQGNKRTAFAALRLFLRANGHDTAFDDTVSWADEVVKLLERQSSEERLRRPPPPLRRRALGANPLRPALLTDSFCGMAQDKAVRGRQQIARFWYRRYMTAA